MTQCGVMAAYDDQSYANYQEEECERGDLRGLFARRSVRFSGTRRARAILPLRIFARVAAQAPSARR
jgi:hypothetical protein